MISLLQQIIRWTKTTTFGNIVQFQTQSYLIVIQFNSIMSESTIVSNVSVQVIDEDKVFQYVYFKRVALCCKSDLTI